MIEVDWKPEASKLRQFGYIAFFGFGLFGFVAWHKFHSMPAVMVFAALALICPVLALIAPRALKPIYLILMLIALPIGFVISNVVLALLFFGMFTPLALFFRLVSRDALGLRRSGEHKTYWKPLPEKRSPRSYYHQY